MLVFGACSAMDSTELEWKEEPSADLFNMDQNNFVGFLDGIQRREDLQEVSGDMDTYAESMFSPTTVASVEHVREHHSALESIVPTVQTGVDVGPVDFDKVFNSAFMSLPSEEPTQVWKTGIWKHIWSLGSTTASPIAFILGN